MSGVPPVVPLPMSAVPWASLRPHLLAALAASDNDGADDRTYELSVWRTPLEGFVPAGQSLAAWAGQVIAQRATFLQGAELGFDLEGSAILAMVEDVSREAGCAPTVTVGLVKGTFDERGERPNGRIGVRFEWPGFDPVAYERCGRVPSVVYRTVHAAGYSVPARVMPDAWREVPPSLLVLVVPPEAGERALLARWSPGTQDDGSWCPPPAGSAERKLLEDMGPAFDDPDPPPGGAGQAVGGSPGPTPREAAKARAWRDPKAPQDEAPKAPAEPVAESLPVMPPVGATDPDTKVLAPGEEPEEFDPPTPPPGPVAIDPVASFSCRRCGAHFVAPGSDARIAEEVRRGCTTCGGDVGEMDVMRPGLDANPRPAREWLPATTPTPFVQPDTGPPPPYAPNLQTRLEEPPAPPKRARKRRPKATDIAAAPGEGALFSEPAVPDSNPDPT